MDSIIKVDSIEFTMTKYFQFEGITQSILDRFKVQVNHDGTEDLEINYSYLDGSVKTCRPFTTPKWGQNNSKHEPKKPRIFGLPQLPKKGKLVVIAAGEKDTIALHSLGIPAITFGSEVLKFNNRVIKYLRERFDEIVILFDRDETGLKQAEIHSKEFTIPYAILPQGSYGKDVTDFLASGGSTEDIEKILSKSISKFYRSMTSYNAGMLQKMKFSEYDYIIPGILPVDSFCALVGASDSGKSLFLLQFAISYVLGNDFLEHKVNGGKKAVYFSLEDSQGSIAGRIDKLTSVLTKSEKDLVNNNLFFKHQKDRIDEHITEHLKAFPDTGIVIIDTFSEIAAGCDINNSGEVRKILKPLHQICLRDEITIILIHHIGKASDREKKMNKNGIVGSQSFESAMRVVFQMNKSTNMFELGITKGNDIDEGCKASKKTLSLTHNTESLWFSKAAENKPIEKSISPKKTSTDWGEIFQAEKKLRYAEIKKRLMDSGISKTPAENRIAAELSAFKNEDGSYNNPTLLVGEVDEEDFEL